MKNRCTVGTGKSKVNNRGIYLSFRCFDTDSLRRRSLSIHEIEEMRFETVTYKRRPQVPMSIEKPKPWSPPSEGRIRARIAPQTHILLTFNDWKLMWNQTDPKKVISFIIRTADERLSIMH